MYVTVEDRDTQDEKLEISITQVPVHGKILRNGTSTRSFTMADLDNNLIFYAHDGSETTGDSFSFTVTDGTHRDFFIFPDTVDSTERPQRMDIEVIPVDNGVPQLIINRGAQFVSELASGKRGFRITKKALRADDRDSEINALKYIITKQPADGQLVRIEDDTTPIAEFTQGNLKFTLRFTCITNNHYYKSQEISLCIDLYKATGTLAISKQL